MIYLLVGSVVPVLGQVVTSEFFSVPKVEGWTLGAREGNVTSWAADGAYHQDLPSNCLKGFFCELEAFTRTVDAFNGSPTWFYEFRVSATSDQNEIAFTSPTVLVAFNSYGESYHATVASDRIQLLRDNNLPVIFVDVEPGVPHTVRVELDNAQPPTYQWFVDSAPVDSGLAEEAFPNQDSRISWQGQTYMQATLNSWYYIRAGVIPLDGSGDFDSDNEVNDFELFYIEECIERSAAGEPAEPSCAWADINADNTVDCTDWTLIQQDLWTGPTPTPTIAACANPIPAVSHWGATALAILTLTGATLLFRRRIHGA